MDVVTTSAGKTSGTAGAARTSASGAARQHSGEVVLAQASHSTCIGIESSLVMVVMVRVNWTGLRRRVRVVALISRPSGIFSVQLTAEW